jgi:hypothetical protein
MNNQTKQAAQSVIEQYDYIGKLDFLKAVKAIVGKIKIDIKALCQLWNDTYGD